MSAPNDIVSRLPDWIAAKEMLYLPKGARSRGDWFKLDKGEAVDGKQYTLYIRADLHEAALAERDERLNCDAEIRRELARIRDEPAYVAKMRAWLKAQGFPYER